jgi:dipeptidyl aminopeptidase/acylaminoacyl peptidase
VIYRPSNFDIRRKYPVIEETYVSPFVSDFPVGFTEYDKAMSMAELGFIVVQVNAMGTGGRSKAFEDVCWHNIGDAGIPDRIRWIKAAADKYPQMDLSRVGVYGGSAGGYDALRSLEVAGDFYKVAVADCGLHEPRLDSTDSVEPWMGWPGGPWYAEQSNVINASKANGKLMLIVCELDQVVDPACTMQVVNALVKANKDFELVVIPNAGHCEDGDYGDRRRKDFFVRHLLGVEPRSK